MDFNSLTKAQLVDYLRANGVDATTRPRKDTLIELAERVFADEMAANVVEEKPVCCKPWWKKLLGI